MNIPQLRFKGFEEEWEKKSFYECVEIKGKLVNPRNEEYQELPHIGPGNIEKFTGKILKYELVKNEELISGKFEFEHKDVVYSKIRPELNKVVFPEFKGLCSADAYPLRAIEGVMEPYFLFQQLMSPKFIKYSISVSMRTGMPKINREELAGFVFYLPKIIEQKKISEFFRLLNLRLQKQQEKIEKLEQFKKGMMQKIFLQELRFKDEDGGEFPEWRNFKLDELLKERQEKANARDLKVHSVAVRAGIINQINHLGRSFAAKDVSNYSVVKNGDIVYTKSPTGDFPYGIIKQSHIEEDVIVSPLYAIYQPKNFYIGYILHSYFTYNTNTNNYLYSIVQKGAKNTINIANKTFVSKKLKFPFSEAEQEKIALFLQYIDKKIETEKLKLQTLEECKKGFMQKMLV